MKSDRSISYIGLGVLLVALWGCGGSSDSPPPFSLSCKTTVLPTGAIRAAVTVKNSSALVGDSYIYGSSFIWIRHVYPLLHPAQVVVETSHGQTPFPAFAVSHVPANGAAHLLLRFQHPPRPVALVVAQSHRVQAQDMSVLNNPDCTIGK